MTMSHNHTILSLAMLYFAMFPGLNCINILKITWVDTNVYFLTVCNF